MAQILDMPRLSDTMKEGVLRKWHKQEGDKLKPGDVLAEIETDKATMDFETFDAGVLLKRLIGDGDAVPVGAPVAIIGKEGEDIDATLKAAEARKGGGRAPVAATPDHAAKPAAPKAPPAPAATETPAPDGKILASPLARRLATDLGVDLRAVQGTGPGGRVVERDVRAAAERSAVTAPLPAPAPAPTPEHRARADLQHPIFPDRRQEARAPAFVVPGQDQTVQPSLVRKTIARRLLEAKGPVPHFYLTVDVDMAAAMEFREQVGQVHGAKLSVNDLCIKASALALRRVPEANAAWSDETIVRYARVDIGMAVAIEDGLLTPVIRSADVKTLGQIAAEAQDLAERARTRKLRPEDMTGATFTVSNLGMMGIKEFTAIINPPEAAILAVGAVRKEPVVKDDRVIVGQRMSLTLSGDHRVIDGALGARLLTAIATILERPITLAF